MEKTTVVHCRKSPYDVYIGRPSKWGNPFKLEAGDDRHAAMNRYREWLLNQPHLLDKLSELQGKILGCWCSPLTCHGDVLAELADTIEEVHS